LPYEGLPLVYLENRMRNGCGYGDLPPESGLYHHLDSRPVHILSCQKSPSVSGDTGSNVSLSLLISLMVTSGW